METKKLIGNKCRELRKQAGFGSYASFAYYYNIPRNTIQRLEEGKNFTIDTLLKVLAIHGISPEKFFKGIK
jgi:transcriptional regulator with XRE-family HTH domain